MIQRSTASVAFSRHTDLLNALNPEIRDTVAPMP